MIACLECFFPNEKHGYLEMEESKFIVECPKSSGSRYYPGPVGL
jgi:hypothetical protein